MGLLDKIIAGGAGDLVEKLGATVDRFVTTKAETEDQRLQAEQIKEAAAQAVRNFELDLLRQAQEAEAQLLKDSADARAANVALQQASGSWLSKNVGYLLDLLLAGIWGGCTLYLIARALHLLNSGGADLTGVLAIYSTVTAAFMTSQTFHRGSSAGSARSAQLQRDLLTRMAPKGHPGG